MRAARFLAASPDDKHLKPPSPAPAGVGRCSPLRRRTRAEVDVGVPDLDAGVSVSLFDGSASSVASFSASSSLASIVGLPSGDDSGNGPTDVAAIDAQLRRRAVRATLSSRTSQQGGLVLPPPRHGRKPPPPPPFAPERRSATATPTAPAIFEPGAVDDDGDDDDDDDDGSILRRSASTCTPPESSDDEFAIPIVPDREPFTPVVKRTRMTRAEALQRVAAIRSANASLRSALSSATSMRSANASTPVPP
uniref:Uncharacterized protein n=2 Tax=Neobodo designis TaxID=312471 RepID=A0A7S1M7P1_NEODS